VRTAGVAGAATTGAGVDGVGVFAPDGVGSGAGAPDVTGVMRTHAAHASAAAENTSRRAESEIGSVIAFALRGGST
jgi:hypothetical protein